MGIIIISLHLHIKFFADIHTLYTVLNASLQDMVLLLDF